MQVEARSPRRGVIRSSLQPEETAGLTRSGDLSRMLPFEAHLLAAGWPRDSADGELMALCRAAADAQICRACLPGPTQPMHALVVHCMEGGHALRLHQA